MTARKQGAKSTVRSDDSLRAAVLAAALAHAPFDGFTDKLLARAGKEAGADAKALAKLFPNGAMSIVEAFSESADREMEKKLSRAKLSAVKIRERIKTAVTARLAILRPHKEAARRAAAFLTLPPHAALGLKLLYRTVDAMWRAAGDTSTDFNFYTKRAISGGRLFLDADALVHRRERGRTSDAGISRPPDRRCDALRKIQGAMARKCKGPAHTQRDFCAV